MFALLYSTLKAGVISGRGSRLLPDAAASRFEAGKTKEHPQAAQVILADSGCSSLL